MTTPTASHMFSGETTSRKSTSAVRGKRGHIDCQIFLDIFASQPQAEDQPQPASGAGGHVSINPSGRNLPVLLICCLLLRLVREDGDKEGRSEERN